MKPQLCPRPGGAARAHRGPFRFMVAFLALFMVPVVILATPQVAHAATVFGPEVVVDSMVIDSGLPKATCSFKGYWVVPPSGNFLNQPHVKVPSVRCDPNWYVDADGGLDCDSDDCTQIVGSVTGAGCQASSSAPMSGGYGVFGEMRFTLPTTCEVSEICLTLDVYANNWNDGSIGPECVPFAVGIAPEGEAVQDCSLFSLAGATATTTPISNYRYNGVAELEGLIYKAGASPITRPRVSTPGTIDNSTGGIQIMAVRRRGSDNSIGVGWTHLQRDIIISSPSTGGMSPLFATWDPGFRADGYQGEPSDYLASIIGIQIYPTGLGNTMAQDTLPQDNPTQGFLGVTDPSVCSFYFGEDIADGVPSTAGPAASDDPAGDVGIGEPAAGGEDPPNTTEPDDDSTVPTGGGCNFSLGDPDSWLSGGMCAVVGLLGQALKLLGKVVDGVLGIASAILDGLADLFVPSDGYLDGKVSALTGDWQDTKPGATVTAFTDQTFDLTGASGCGGIPMQVDLPGGVQIDENIGEACSGTMATVASVVKLVSSLLLVVFGGLAVLRALGSGFGWDPGIGRGSPS